MQGAEDARFYIGAGGLAAILLGIALVPLRELTPASNLAFAFMALTIVVAELGGPAPALVTALTSSLSLDFFLTQPYLRLSIEDKHDVIAFLGLSACGLIAAGLAAQRDRRLATLTAVAKHRELLHSLLCEWDATAPIGPQLSRIPETLARLFPLAAVAVRGADDQVLARTPGSEGLPIPEAILEPDRLQPGAGVDRRTEWDLSLPREGGRITLTAVEGRVGWLDVWGDGRPASVEARRALSDVARLLALRLATGGRAAGVPRV